MSPLGLSRSLAPSASLVCQLFRVLDDMSGSGGGSERGTGRAKKNDGAENEKFLPQLHNYTETRNRVSVTEKTSLFLLIRCETGLVDHTQKQAPLAGSAFSSVANHRRSKSVADL